MKHSRQLAYDDIHVWLNTARLGRNDQQQLSNKWMRSESICFLSLSLFPFPFPFSCWFLWEQSKVLLRSHQSQIHAALLYARQINRSRTLKYIIIMPLQPILCLLALGLASVSHSQDTIAFAVNTLTIVCISCDGWCLILGYIGRTAFIIANAGNSKVLIIA